MPDPNHSDDRRRRLERWWLQHGNDWFRVAYALLGDWHRAQDVAKEALLRLDRKASEDEAPTQPGAYGARVALNMAKDLVRRSKCDPSEQVPEPPGDGREAGFDAAMRSWRRSEVAQGMRGLGDHDRLLLFLRFWDDRTVPEIAYITGSSDEPPSRRAVAATEKALQQAQVRFLGALRALTIVDECTGRCAQLDRLVARFGLSGLGATLTPLSRKSLARHADRCDHCRAVADSRVRREEMLAASPALAAALGFADEAFGAQRMRPWTRPSPAMALIAAAAAILVALFAAGDLASGVRTAAPDEGREHSGNRAATQGNGSEARTRSDAPSSSAGTADPDPEADPTPRRTSRSRRSGDVGRSQARDTGDARRSPARDTGNAGRSPAHDTDDAPPPPRDDEPSPAEPDASPAGPVAVHTPAPVAPRPLPDLVITDLSNVSVAIANHGDAATGPFEVEVDGLAEPLLFPDGLAAGGSTTAGYSCLAPDAFTAIIDPAGTIDESDETNNAASARGMC